MYQLGKQRSTQHSCFTINLRLSQKHEYHLYNSHNHNGPKWSCNIVLFPVINKNSEKEEKGTWIKNSDSQFKASGLVDSFYIFLLDL